MTEPVVTDDAMIEIPVSRTHRLRDLDRFISDLDRCVHGRHEGDVCAGCRGGVSLGNPIFITGQVIGWGLDGATRIVVPPRGERHDPANWRNPR